MVIFVLLSGLFAGLISGIVGTGASMILLPVLTIFYGPKDAIPIMTVAAVLANIARVLVWWRAIDWRSFGAYAAPGCMSAALGARTLLSLPPRLIEASIGIFLLAMIPFRRWLAARLTNLTLTQVAIFGLVIGFVTGLVVSTGPVSGATFLGYGLTKGTYIGTEAAASLSVYFSKGMVFWGGEMLRPQHLLNGALVGGAISVGTLLSKPLVHRISPNAFRYVMDAILFLSGIMLLLGWE